MDPAEARSRCRGKRAPPASASANDVAWPDILWLLALPGAGAEQDSPNAPEVSFVTGVLVDTLTRTMHREPRAPRRCPHGRVLHRELVLDGARVDAGDPLDEVQVRVAASEDHLRREVDRVDHERI